jgi:acetylornithine/succinyldiaminopimelate/putrescine aminotransferase
MNALGKMLFLDCAFGIGMLALARFAPETKKALEEQAKETLAQVAPETAEQLEQLQQQAAEVSP